MTNNEQTVTGVNYRAN